MKIMGSEQVGVGGGYDLVPVAVFMTSLVSLLLFSFLGVFLQSWREAFSVTYTNSHTWEMNFCYYNSYMECLGGV